MLRKLVKEKRKLWTELNNAPSISSWTRYKGTRNSVARLVVELRRKYERGLTQQLNSPKSIKASFRYVNHQKAYIDNGISLTDEKGELVSEADSATLFSDHFSSVYNRPIERGEYEDSIIWNEGNNIIFDIVVSEEMVLQQLELMDVKKSPGPDGHPKLLRKYSSFFCKPLYIIFTQSLRMGILA